MSCCQGWWGVSRDPGAGQRPGPIKAEPTLSKPHWLVGLVSGRNYKTSSPTQELKNCQFSPPNLHAIIKISRCIWIQTMKFISDCKWYVTCIWLKENTCKVQDVWMFLHHRAVLCSVCFRHTRYHRIVIIAGRTELLSVCRPVAGAGWPACVCLKESQTLTESQRLLLVGFA